MRGPRRMGSILWGGKQQIIYKHAISTIAPMRTVDLAGE
ncbi:MAG: RNA chaperone Hfq [Dysosmobacter sp.]|nr:RNA chaperone Hfq [Dysosmobacter sp.]